MVELDSFRAESRYSGYWSFDGVDSFRAEIRGGLPINLMMNFVGLGAEICASPMNLMMKFVGLGAEIDGNPHEFDDDLMKWTAFGLRFVVASPSV